VNSDVISTATPVASDSTSSSIETTYDGPDGATTDSVTTEQISSESMPDEFVDLSTESSPGVERSSTEFTPTMFGTSEPTSMNGDDSTIARGSTGSTTVQESTSATFTSVTDSALTFVPRQEISTSETDSDSALSTELSSSPSFDVTDSTLQSTDSFFSKIVTTIKLDVDSTFGLPRSSTTQSTDDELTPEITLPPLTTGSDFTSTNADSATSTSSKTSTSALPDTSTSASKESVSTSSGGMTQSTDGSSESPVSTANRVSETTITEVLTTGILLFFILTTY
jgi:hypothetical protein